MKKAVICCGLERSGSTLSYLLVRDLMEQFYSPVVLYRNWFQNIWIKEGIFESNTNYVVKTHPQTDDKSWLYKKHEAIFICTYRDLRDITASWMQCGKMGTSGGMVNFVNRTLRNWKYWGAKKNVHKFKYELFCSDI